MIASLLLPFLLAPAPQEPPPILARYQLRGQSASVDADEVALEMAFHSRRTEEGRAACSHLLDTTLVRLEAKAQGLLPDDAEIERFRQSLLAQLPRSAQRAEQAQTIKTLPADELASSIAFDRLVRKALDLRADEPTGDDMRKLWLQERKKRHRLVDDPDQLPVGTAVRVDDTDVPMLQLGRLLLYKAGEQQRELVVRRLVVLKTLEAMAAEHHIEVGEADLQAEVEARAAAASSDPRYHGLTFAQLLKSQGLTLPALLQSRVFRGNVMQKKLVAALHPRQELLAEIARDRAAVLERCGPRRHLAGIFLRALEQPNELVPRDFAAAERELQALRQKLTTTSFDMLAKVESEDPDSKARGGDLGWVFRRAKGLPEPVLSAAFGLDRDAVSAPIRCEDGVWVIKLLGIEPDPTDDELVVRMQEQLLDDLLQQILQDAAIAMGPAPKATGK